MAVVQLGEIARLLKQDPDAPNGCRPGAALFA
jgi:hypothetical protein